MEIQKYLVQVTKREEQRLRWQLQHATARPPKHLHLPAFFHSTGIFNDLKPEEHTAISWYF